jgi:hypothetical protein
MRPLTPPWGVALVAHPARAWALAVWVAAIGAAWLDAAAAQAPPPESPAASAPAPAAEPVNAPPSPLLSVSAIWVAPPMPLATAEQVYERRRRLAQVKASGLLHPPPATKPPVSEPPNPNPGKAAPTR